MGAVYAKESCFRCNPPEASSNKSQQNGNTQPDARMALEDRYPSLRGIQRIDVEATEAKDRKPSVVRDNSRRDVFSIFGQAGLEVDFKAESPLSVNLETIPDSCTSSIATELIDPQDALIISAAPEFTYSALGVCFGAQSLSGKREKNEDRFSAKFRKTVGDEGIACFGVFDGHGGDFTSQYLSDNLHNRVLDVIAECGYDQHSIEKAFIDCDNEIYSLGQESGSTAVVMTMKGGNIFFSSLGDSQAILSNNGVAQNMCAIHIPSAPGEYERIIAANGTITKDRIFGVLAVSRAFGDNEFKTSRGEFKHKFRGDLVSNMPDVVRHTLTPGDEFVVLASDGVFDVVSPQQVVNFVRSRLQTTGDLQATTKALVSYALNLGSRDNISAVIVCFHQHSANVELPLINPADSDSN